MLIQDCTEWEKTTEVIVVGYGAAGAAAAIAAREEGADVVILEKQQAENHISSSHMSGGLFASLSNLERGEEFIRCLCRAGGGASWTDPEVIEAWAEYVSKNKDWMESLGAKIKRISRKEFQNVPGVEAIEYYTVSGGGLGFMQVLSRKATSLNIPVIYGASGTRLLTNPAAEVIGVKATLVNGREANFRSYKGVILACGGFEFNENMKLQYLKVYPSYFCGSPANTGDGIKMALDVGSDLWHMNCCPGRLVAKFPDFPVAFTIDLGGRGWTIHEAMGTRSNLKAGYVIVDKHGKRYTAESYRPHLLYYEIAMYDSKLLQYPRIPSFWIFDQKRFESGPLPTVAAGASRVGLYKWSPDNRKEVESGWILTAESIPQLASLLKVDPEALSQTIHNYNMSCSRGEDAEFGRHPDTLIPINQPPFYAVKLYPGGPSTQGGPRRNAKSQIVNAEGEPVRRLYGAGELGSIYGMFYVSGFHLAECIAFGRIAGRNAAREHALSSTE